MEIEAEAEPAGKQMGTGKGEGWGTVLTWADFQVAELGMAVGSEG